MHLSLPILTLASAAGVQAWDSTIHSTVAPTAPPSVTEEPWRCVTENATSFFKVPLPTGALSSAIDSYVDAQMEACLKTIEPEHALYGCFPSKEAWCSFTKVAPTAVLPAWTSLGSSASSFWAKQSSAAVSLARQCPLRWYDTSLGVIGGATFLNQTIIMSACYEEAVSPSVTRTTSKSTSLSSASKTSTTGAVTTSTGKANNVREVPEVWMVMSTGIAVAAMAL